MGHFTKRLAEDWLRDFLHDAGHAKHLLQLDCCIPPEDQPHRVISVRPGGQAAAPVGGGRIGMVRAEVPWVPFELDRYGSRLSGRSPIQ